MPVKIWSGASSGNMATAGNYVGGVAPLAGDTVIFDRGSVSVTAWTAVELVNVTITQGYTGSIGTSGSPLAMTEGITGTLKVGGKQTGVYLSVPNAKAIATLSAESGVVTISGSGTGAVTTANVSSGASFVATVPVLTTLNVVTPDSSAIVATSGTAITTANVIGRLETTDRNITTLNVGGSGRVVAKGTTAITTATIGNGGTLNKQSSSTDTTVTVQFGGTLTNEGNTYMDNGSGTAPTVTTLNLWSGSKFIPNGVGNLLTVTTTAYIGAAGGDRPFDPIG